VCFWSDGGTVMFANLSDIIKIPVAILAGMIISAVFLIFFYEGLSLPLIGQVIDGRVASAVKTATSSMVTKSSGMPFSPAG
jgi:hypothetical protein